MNGPHKKRQPSLAELYAGIVKGDTTSLARAITLVESTREDAREKAYALMERCLPVKQKTLRIGVTGAPGVGKSTFIETLGAHITAGGTKVAVLAVDPSSSLSKGSILGDKTRMTELGKNPRAFIRPSPASEQLGGVARTTREAIVLCEAAGFEVILVETVGVGQSETTVHSMVDFFLLLQLAGAGDELQGIKRGIMEMADALVINKADGGNMEKADEARALYSSALQLYPPKENGWIPQVLTCSSTENKGIDVIWELLGSFGERYWDSGELQARRREQNRYWFRQTVETQLTDRFYSSPGVREQLGQLQEKVANDEISPFRAASLLLRAYRTGT